jgi:hypothetical protein
MTPPANGTSTRRTASEPGPEAALLEALAAAGEALTQAILHHDFDAIVAATKDAEAAMAKLGSTPSRSMRHPTPVEAPSTERRLGTGRRGLDRRPANAARDTDAPDPAVLLVAARIGATARRNALLLEQAWATDASLLRLIATAARDDHQSTAGTGYAPSPQRAPAGWLDRSA